ncbi:NACHT domain-containing protein [Streptomyces sp. NPDC006314]|uniref:NACHT domain-containing protein n=1 Tax=Streptomyces sp. NPDC006314 TaxID=3154475 RepID=UPI0033A40CA8
MVDVPHDGVVATVVVDRYRGDTHRRRDRSYLRRSADHFTEQAKRLGFNAPPLRVASSGDADTTGSTLDRGRVRELVTRLREQPAGRKVLYWTGHGERIGDTFYLACQDTYADGAFAPDRAVSASELVSWLAEDAADTLLVLDACFSGTALDDVNEQVKAARGRVGDGTGGDAGFAVIATAEADEEATEGRWVACLRHVLDTPDAETRAVPLFHRENPVVAFTHLMLAVRALMRDQVPEWYEVRALRPDFLFNPYCSERVKPALRSPDDESWIGEELSADVMPVFSDAGESWQLRDFASRDRVLGELVTWMVTRSTGLFAVSGASGAGKSTLLTYLAHLTTRGFSASLPADRRPRIQPELYSVHAALHCRGKTLAVLCEELGHRLGALGLGQTDLAYGAPHTYVERIAALAQRKGSLTLLFDGLDEAAAGHAFDIARGLINPLAGTPLVKVVVATRPNARRNLPGGLPAETLLEALHCEDPVELDRLPETEGDIALHVEHLLGQDNSPYRLAEAEETRRTVARHIASRSNGLFLVATLWARRLARLSTLPEPERLDDELRHGTAALESLLSDELDRLDPAEPARIRDLLRPLALAQGNGLPQPRVWLAMANAVRPPGSKEYTEDDLRFVIAVATGVAIARDDEFGTEVHRLHHPSFGAHLLGDEARQCLLHRRIVLALRPSRSEHWAKAEPYVAHYIAAHAALADDATLDELTSDYHFAVHASPDILEPLVATRLAIAPRPALYVQVADHFRTHPRSAARWAMLRATALAMFPAEVLDSVPHPPEVFWNDVWSSADRLPLQRSWPAPLGGAFAVHWEGHGNGIIHAAGAGEIRSWTAGGHEIRGRDTGPAGWSAACRQRGLAVAEGGGNRVIVTHDGLALRLWRGEERHPFEELYWGGSPDAVAAAWWNGLVHLAAVEGGRLWLWKWDGKGPYGRELLRLRVLPAAVSCVALLPLAGSVVAVAGGPRGLTLWAVPFRGTVTSEPLHGAAPLLTTDQPVRAVSALAPRDGRGAVVAALDGRALSVWRLPDPLFGSDRELLLHTASGGQAVSVGEGPKDCSWRCARAPRCGSGPARGPNTCLCPAPATTNRWRTTHRARGGWPWRTRPASGSGSRTPRTSRARPGSGEDGEATPEPIRRRRSPSARPASSCCAGHRTRTSW